MEKIEEKEVQKHRNTENWSEAVEDLVSDGDKERAIALLEKVISELETLGPSKPTNLQLSSALNELANLYSSKNFSLKSDELLSRASLLRHRALSPATTSETVKKVKGLLDEVEVSKPELVANGSYSDGCTGKSVYLDGGASHENGSSDDDWEAVADRSPDELFSTSSMSSVSNVSVGETYVQNNKRRGRGTFSYKKSELYSDRVSNVSSVDEVEDETKDGLEPQDVDAKHYKYGVRHVLVLADFPPSTRTLDLEKLFENFRKHEVVIRWVNDTTALAVFRTPSIAHEAHNHILFPFPVRILDEDDALLGSIPPRDLEPPWPRPQTSARTAQRLIAQGMGLKLSNPTFGSRELKTQEEARKSRIVTRQKMRDDAWGED